MRVRVGCEFNHDSADAIPDGLAGAAARRCRRSVCVFESWGTSPAAAVELVPRRVRQRLRSHDVAPGPVALRYDAEVEVPGSVRRRRPRRTPGAGRVAARRHDGLPAAEPVLLVRRAPRPGVGALRRNATGMVAGRRRVRLGPRERPVPGRGQQRRPPRPSTCGTAAPGCAATSRTWAHPVPEPQHPGPLRVRLPPRHRRAPSTATRWTSAPGSRPTSSDRWWTFDPRNNVPRAGRVVIGRGRDALDVAMVTTYGCPDPADDDGLGRRGDREPRRLTLAPPLRARTPGARGDRRAGSRWRGRRRAPSAPPRRAHRGSTRRLG